MIEEAIEGLDKYGVHYSEELGFAENFKRNSKRRGSPNPITEQGFFARGTIRYRMNSRLIKKNHFNHFLCFLQVPFIQLLKHADNVAHRACFLQAVERRP